MSAVYTNSITNALHATFLFLYFLGAFYHYYKKDNTFSGLITLWFLILVILKLAGVYVHYYPSKALLPPVWLAISFCIILLNYLLIHGMNTSVMLRFFVIFISCIFVYLFILSYTRNYLYIALLVLIVYTIAAIKTKGLLRAGFVMVILSNIIWIAARQITIFKLGHAIPVQYRYDNDIYHLLLIISTFIIFLAISKGLWPYPPGTFVRDK